VSRLDSRSSLDFGALEAAGRIVGTRAQGVGQIHGRRERRIVSKPKSAAPNVSSTPTRSILRETTSAFAWPVRYTSRRNALRVEFREYSRTISAYIFLRGYHVVSLSIFRAAFLSMHENPQHISRHVVDAGAAGPSLGGCGCRCAGAAPAALLAGHSGLLDEGRRRFGYGGGLVSGVRRADAPRRLWRRNGPPRTVPRLPQNFAPSFGRRLSAAAKPHSDLSLAGCGGRRFAARRAGRRNGFR
jgi:hypothetical protein